MIKTPIRPMMEINVSITVHDKNVCLSERLKNSLNIQKPESLMCEPNTLPAPTDSTINSGDTPVLMSGATTPAAVIPATVAEPMDTRNNAVTIHAKRRGGMFNLLLNDEI